MNASAEQQGFDAVVLGRVTGLFGVRGWVKVWSYTDPREAVLEYGPWFIGRDGCWQPVRLAEGRRHGKAVIARLEGIDDRDAAADLLESDIAVDSGSLPRPDDGSWYWRDLEGLSVRQSDGRDLGTVDYVLETGANDVLVVAGQTDSGRTERLIPFILGTVVLNVDLDEGVIDVDWDWE